MNEGTYDEVLCSGKNVNPFPISSELSLSCKQANARYKKDLAEKNSLKQGEAIGQKKETPTECADIKCKKSEEEEVIKDLEIKVSELISKAAAEKNTKAIWLQIIQAESFKDTNC